MTETIPVETPSAAVPSVDDGSLYIHREPSQLQFNIRVLEQAPDESYPFLERLKFLLIFSSNLDEFLETRITGLKKQITFTHEQAGADDLLPHQALARISELVREQVSRQHRILNETLSPELARHQIRFIRRRHWTLKIKTWVQRSFRDEITPIITPIGLDPTHPFPLLVNKDPNFIVRLEGVDVLGRDLGLTIIPVPCPLPRIIKLPKDASGESDNYVFLPSMIHAHADDLFPSIKVRSCYQFYLTHNTDLSVDTEDVEGLARVLCGELFSCRCGDAVHLEMVDTRPQNLTNHLLKQFGLSENELYKVSGPVNLTRLFSVTGLESHLELQYPPFTPTVPCLLQKEESPFSVLSKFDVLLIHSFESFIPVIDLLRQAAKDPNVLAVKQTLYRNGANSGIVDVLVETTRNGKGVIAVIELRARFDEKSSLQLVNRLQQASTIVIHGVIGFKTHAKMMLILRRENGELRHYAHLGTSNYYAGDARLYIDYSPPIVDVALYKDPYRPFNQLIGMGKALCMEKLLHAPFTLKKNLLEMVNHETARAALGQPARIMAEVNSLADPEVIRALCKTDQTGIRVGLVVRGMYYLRPDIPGVSHNTHTRPIIGHFLEHSHICYLLNGGDEKLHPSSADWMEHSLDMRVEACFSVEDKKLMQRVKKKSETYLTDNTRAWALQADGSYQRLNPTDNQNPRNTRATLLKKLAAPVLTAR